MRVSHVDETSVKPSDPKRPRVSRVGCAPIILMGLACAQTPQVAPWTYEPTDGVQTLVFVQDECNACVRLAAALDHLDVVYLGRKTACPTSHTTTTPLG